MFDEEKESSVKEYLKEYLKKHKSKLIFYFVLLSVIIVSVGVIWGLKGYCVTLKIISIPTILIALIVLPEGINEGGGCLFVSLAILAIAGVLIWGSVTLEERVKALDSHEVVEDNHTIDKLSREVPVIFPRQIKS